METPINKNIRAETNSNSRTSDLCSGGENTIQVFSVASQLANVWGFEMYNNVHLTFSSDNVLAFLHLPPFNDHEINSYSILFYPTYPKYHFHILINTKELSVRHSAVVSAVSVSVHFTLTAHLNWKQPSPRAQ